MFSSNSGPTSVWRASRRSPSFEKFGAMCAPHVVRLHDDLVIAAGLGDEHGGIQGALGNGILPNDGERRRRVEECFREIMGRNDRGSLQALELRIHPAYPGCVTAMCRRHGEAAQHGKDDSYRQPAAQDTDECPLGERDVPRLEQEMSDVAKDLSFSERVA